MATLEKIRKRQAPKSSEPEPITDALLRAIRKQELTAYRLSKMTGSSIDSIQRFMDRKQGLTLKTVNRLVDALGLIIREPV
jgi:hypothetical protein